jgi:(2Fe-2S) ferredoxin
MERITLSNIDEIKKKNTKDRTNNIKVGMSTCGIAAGADEIYNLLTDEIKKRNLNVSILKCGCYGMCYAEPLVEVDVQGLPRVIYGNVDKETAIKIVDKHATGERLINDHIIKIIERD